MKKNAKSKHRHAQKRAPNAKQADRLARMHRMSYEMFETLCDLHDMTINIGGGTILHV